MYDKSLLLIKKALFYLGVKSYYLAMIIYGHSKTILNHRGGEISVQFQFKVLKPKETFSVNNYL